MATASSPRLGYDRGMSETHAIRRSAWLAMASAALFGASTPFAKLLIGDGLDPWLLAGLLYLGSGVGLGLLYGARRLLGIKTAEAPLRRADIPWLGLIVLSGGIIGPALLMAGLATSAASSAALLLNLEGLATMAIAWLVFRESVDGRLLLGAAAILAGAVILSWGGGPGSVGRGEMAIVGACVAWAIDNNLTRKLSGGDPVQIAAIKGAAAGATNLALAIAAGAALPAPDNVIAAAGVGFAGYGVSLVLFMLALRGLGTARTSAYFSTAPFIGAVLAIAIFDEPVTAGLVIAGLLMAGGLYLHLAERHAHPHEHEALEHEHKHAHDEHHQHAHDAGKPAGEPHTHRHRHLPIVHAHPHYPDLHHRHRHGHA
jgi:drug/metabolite transporter (DMT)-like permease